MATWTIKPKKGTTQQWTDSERILEENEWGVEVTTSGNYILRIGDGEHKFMELPAVVDTDDLKTLHAAISNYAANMQTAAAAANAAATAANTATTAATAAANACEGIAAGINSIPDTATGKTYTIGVENGLVFLEEITE